MNANCYSNVQSPDDVVITLAIRTPLAKGKKGGFKDTDLDYMVYVLLKKVLEKSKIDPNLIEDICMGNVRPRRANLSIKFSQAPTNTTSFAGQRW